MINSLNFSPILNRDAGMDATLISQFLNHTLHKNNHSK